MIYPPGVVVVAEILLGQVVKEVLKRPGVKEVLVNPEVEVKVTMPASGEPGPPAVSNPVLARDWEYPVRGDKYSEPLSRGGHWSMATSDAGVKGAGKGEGEAVGVGWGLLGKEGLLVQKRLLTTTVLSTREGLKTKEGLHACLTKNNVELGKIELRVAYKHLGEVGAPMLIPRRDEAPG